MEIPTLPGSPCNIAGARSELLLVAVVLRRNYLVIDHIEIVFFSTSIFSFLILFAIITF